MESEAGMSGVPRMDTEFLTVLLADDEPRTRRALRALLVTIPEVGMVADCADGAEALAIVERLHPDVVILNDRMPQMNGVEATRRIKESRPETGVVLLATLPGTGVRDRAGGADVLLPGGYAAEDLRSAVLRAEGHGRGRLRERLPDKVSNATSTRETRGAEIRTILVPTDFSVIANDAFRSAGMLALRFGARIIAVHVQEDTVSRLIDDYPSVDELRKVGELHRKQARRRLEGVVARHLPEGIGVELRVPLGTPHVEISRLAERKEVDVIVMATHGRGFISHLLLGSTTEQVIKRSPCPVFVVRGGHGPEPSWIPRERIAI